MPNWKCVWFTAAVAAGYWWLPPRRWGVLLALLILPYVAMAWYDVAYGCHTRLQPTLVPFGRWLFLPLKPPQYQAEFRAMPPAAHAAMDALASWVAHSLAWGALVGAAAWAATRYRV